METNSERIMAAASGERRIFREPARFDTQREVHRQLQPS